MILPVINEPELALQVEHTKGVMADAPFCTLHTLEFNHSFLASRTSIWRRNRGGSGRPRQVQETLLERALKVLHLKLSTTVKKL